jgi:hypothetical protein
MIPGGLTSMLQMLDVCINQLFKVTLKEQYTRWMAAAEHEFTPTGKIKRPDVEQLSEWIREAWARISPTLIEKSFKKCCICNKLDDTEDDYLWDSDPDQMSSVDDDDDKSSTEEYLCLIFSVISHSFHLTKYSLNMTK